MAHTPGPWTASKKWVGIVTHQGDGGLRAGPNEGVLGDCLAGPPDHREANARLIAAAPDLLAACRKAADALLVGDNEHFRMVARGHVLAAIAKAEGS